MEPRRLLQQGATNAERTLLNSARADGPPAGAAQRMLAVLEGLGNPSPSAGGPMAAHSLKLGALAKVGLVALVGLGALGAGSLVHWMAGRQSVSSETSGTRAPVVQESPVAGPAELPTFRDSFLVESPPPGAASETSAALRGAGTATRHGQANAMEGSLGAEIRLLDIARAAVDGHNPAAAQRALDSYARRFPQGHLKPEATVLRLAVLVRRGNRPAARSLAAELLADESYKAYGCRIRSLLRETEE